MYAPRAIQSAQLELERQQATDSLRKGLEKRPEREELIERTDSQKHLVFL